MTFTLDDEDALAPMIDVVGHVVVSERPRPIVTRDGLRVYVHRQLYRRVVGEVKPTEYLLRDCVEPLCVNPFHYTLSTKPYRVLQHCPNGHRYTTKDRLPEGRYRCMICAEARRKRRPRLGPHPHWVKETKRQWCPYAHPYIPENMYEYPTKWGGVRRKCKTCAKARSAGIDPATVTYP